jgi:nucleotide-binding universal stress UspA family protein
MDAGTETNSGDAPREDRQDAGEDRVSRVVVGVDGSSGSRGALVYALIAAGRRVARLEVVAAYPETLVWTGGYPLDVPDMDAVRDDAATRATAFLAEVRADPAVVAATGATAVDARVVVVAGRAVEVLLHRALGADLLVVGSRGRGAMRSALLGSVALHCVSNPPCPVVVVRPQPVSVPPAVPPRVVVGVDGSPASRAALLAAVDEAARTGAELDVVAAYVLTDYWVDLGSVLLPSVEQIRADLQRRTDDQVAAVLAARPGGAAVPPVTTHLVEGAAGEVLVHQALGADLLVVGSAGRGAVRGLLLGSVALHCAMHGTGPVMVVHSRRDHPAVPAPRHQAAMADG